MVCLSDAKLEAFPVGSIWAIAGAVAYALYLVTLKRKVTDDQQLDVPMFFGKLPLLDTVLATVSLGSQAICDNFVQCRKWLTEWIH